MHDSKSIFKEWIAKKTCLFFGQLYYFTSWNYTGVYSDTPWWAVSARRFRMHRDQALCPRLQVPAWHSTKSDESMPTCFCNRETVACVQRLTNDLMLHIQRHQRMGEELSHSLVHQHWNYLPNYLKYCSLTLVMFKRSLKTFCFKVLVHPVH